MAEQRECKFCGGLIRWRKTLTGQWEARNALNGDPHECRLEIQHLVTEAFERGFRAGVSSRQPQFTSADWQEIVLLTHPDRHPTRSAEANRITAKLLALRDGHAL